MPPEGTSPSASSKHERGKQLYSLKKYQKAIESFTHALQLDPDNVATLANRSASYAALGKFDLGLNDAKQCIALSPDWPKGYFRAATHCRGMQDYEQAVQYLKIANVLQPMNQEIVDLIEQTKLDMFFQEKTKSLGVSVKYSGGASVGLAPNKTVVACKSFKKGAVLFTESPVASVQSIINRETLLACHHCMKSLATFADLKLPQSFSQCRSSWMGQTTKPVTCGGCRARFCSTACQEQASEEYHGVQCNSSALAFEKFEDWCRNEVLAHKQEPGMMELLDVIVMAIRLAAKMLCAVVQKYITTGASLDECMRPFAPFVYGTAGLSQDALAFDYRPAFQFLRDALLCDTDPELTNFLTFEEFLKMVRRVALSCPRVTSCPFTLLCKEVGSKPRAFRPGVLAVLEEMEYEKGLDTASRGCGLFHLHSSINHCCSPNVEVVSETLLDHQIAITACRDIVSGEELLSCYLPDESATYHERQERLRNCYEFTCRCDRCKVEGTTQA